MSKSISEIKRYTGNVLMTLFCLVVMLDPTGSITHLKDKVFVLLVAFNIVAYKPDYRYLLHILVPIAVIFFCYVMATVQGNIPDDDEMIALLKSVAPLILLLWVGRYNIIKQMSVPAVLICIITIVCWVLTQTNEIFEQLIYKFVVDHDMTMKISRRSIMGFEIHGCYYKSFVTVMFTMYIVIYNMFNSSGWFYRSCYVLLFTLFFFASSVSGTRSSMLLPFAMIGMVSYRQILSYHKVRYVLLPVLAIFLFVFVFFVITLASETSELSNTIKYGHLNSYIDLFVENPLYLILGQGPATQFYSEGFRRFTYVTEWTYIELLRNFGILSLLILGVFIFPLVCLWKYARKSNYVFGIFCTYVIYIFIAGTNPLLLSSTGMIMILAIYSFKDGIEKNRIDIKSKS